MLPFACLLRPIDDSIFISKTKTPHSGDKNEEFNEQAAEPVRDLRKVYFKSTEALALFPLIST